MQADLKFWELDLILDILDQMSNYSISDSGRLDIYQCSWDDLIGDILYFS